MAPGSLRDRIADQFSDRGERAGVWRAFGRLFDTGAFLNLGYSEWYRPHALGSSQRRLAAELGAGLAPRLPDRGNDRLLDVGCGRGGPTRHLAGSLDVRATGIDLVPYNVAAARGTAAGRDEPVEFAVGEATRLPVATGAVAAYTAIDALVYVPEKRAAFEEAARVLGGDGVLAVSDLLMAGDGDGSAPGAVAAFAEAWDMAPLLIPDRYLDHVERAGFDVGAVRDVTGNSVGRLRAWTKRYLALATRFEGAVDRLLGRWGVDGRAFTEQVRRAHAALPELRHVIVYATRS